MGKIEKEKRKMPNFYDILSYSYVARSKEKEEKYREATEAYKRITHKTALFYKDVNLDDELKISCVFNYMLWNGYWSINHKYKYSTSNLRFITGYFGMNIMTGKGVCRENAEFLTRIIQESGFFSMNFPCLIEKCQFDYRPDIKRQIEKPSALKWPILLLMLPLQKSLLNHATVLVEKDGHYYMVDPTNLCIFKIDNYLVGHLINGIGNFRIRPWSIAICNKTNEDEVFDIIDSYDNGKEYLTEEYFKDLSESMLSFCKKNISLFDDFHNGIKSDIDIVNIKIKKHHSIKTEENVNG